MNTFDNDVVVESASRVLWRDLTTNIDRLVVQFTLADPNGVLTGPVGSIAAGPAGIWRGLGGTAWLPISGATGAQGSVYQLGTAGGVAYSDDAGAVETVIATVAIPAGLLNSVGRSVRAYAAGHCDDADVNLGTFRIRLGGLGGDILAELAGAAPSGAGADWVMDSKHRVNIAGAAAALSASTVQRTFGAGAAVEILSTSTGIGPFDLTGVLNLVVTCAFSAAAAQTGTLDTFLVDVTS